MPVISLAIPGIEKRRDLIGRNAGEKSAHRRVTDDAHVLGKQGMAPSIVRIVLTGVVFIDDQVADKVRNELGLVAERILEERVQTVFVNDSRKGNVGAYADGVASPRRVGDRRQPNIGEMLEKVFIRYHARLIVGRDKLADDDSLGNVELTLRVVDAFGFEENVAACAFLLEDDLSLGLWNLDRGVEIHNVSRSLSVTVTLNYNIKLQGFNHGVKELSR